MKFHNFLAYLHSLLVCSFTARGYRPIPNLIKDECLVTSYISSNTYFLGIKALSVVHKQESTGH